MTCIICDAIASCIISVIPHIIVCDIILHKKDKGMIAKLFS